MGRKSDCPSMVFAIDFSEELRRNAAQPTDERERTANARTSIEVLVNSEARRFTQAFIIEMVVSEANGFRDERA